MLRTYVSLCAVSIASLLLAGCGEVSSSLESSAGAAMINTVCPIMGGEAKSDVAVDWNGKKVGFCCAPCIEEWNELSDTERTAKLESAAKGDADHAHGDADHGHEHSEGSHGDADHEHAEKPAAAAETPAAP